MPVYVVADVTVIDPEMYATYAAGSPATITAHGGRYLARGGAVEVLEGDWVPKRAVIVEFPDVMALRAWYESAEYTVLRRIRESAAEARIVVVNGV